METGVPGESLELDAGVSGTPLIHLHSPPPQDHLSPTWGLQLHILPFSSSLIQSCMLPEGLCVCAQSLQVVQLCNPMDCSPPGSSCPWDSPGKDTGAGCHALLQGIFPTQGSNPGLMFPALAGGFLTTIATWEAYSTA